VKKMNKKQELEKGSFGTAALVTGILGLFLFPFLLSLLAIIFGAIAKSKQERHGTAGLILGIIGLVWGFFLLLVMSMFWLALLSSLA
jgi:hypothetical protein